MCSVFPANSPPKHNQNCETIVTYRHIQTSCRHIQTSCNKYSLLTASISDVRAVCISDLQHLSYIHSSLFGVFWALQLRFSWLCFGCNSDLADCGSVATRLQFRFTRLRFRFTELRLGCSSDLSDCVSDFPDCGSVAVQFDLIAVRLWFSFRGEAALRSPAPWIQLLKRCDDRKI